ncbi:MAG: hypothetical protein HQ523_02920 [Lentisphaerae bacterium]|nr:hypothetical protein [Lentisphaerota bacterium]
MPGWNAVQLLVQPVDSTCEAVFTNTPVDKVYWWRRDETGFEFDLDPEETFPHTADWEYWFSTNAPLSSFGAVLAGESYEILVPSNSVPFSLYVKGQVVLNSTTWVPTLPNLVGLPVPAGEQVSFSEFFGFSDDFEIGPSYATLFRVDTNGASQRIFQPSLTGVRRGEAYWVTAGDDARSYDGPIHVTTDSGVRLLRFDSLSPQNVLIENVTQTNRQIAVTQMASELPPSGVGAEPLLGPIPLLLGAPDGSYTPFTGTLVTNLAVGETLRLKLAPDPQLLTNGTPGTSWQGVLKISDAGNLQYSDATVDVRIGMAATGDLTGQRVPAGLWLGSVRASHVSRAPARSEVEPVWDETEPLPVAEPFEWRLIMHVDSGGEVKLLQRVLVAWLPEGGEVVVTPSGTITNGAFELLSDESTAADYQALHPDTEITRISSVALPLMAPVAASGALGPDNTVNCLVDLPFDDPVNPFVHLYHPQHDNLKYENGVAIPLAEGVESYRVTRTLWFTFVGADPASAAINPQWGVTENGGTFREQVQGLNKTIFVEGSFRLQKVSDVPLLQ